MAICATGDYIICATIVGSGNAEHSLGDSGIPLPRCQQPQKKIRVPGLGPLQPHEEIIGVAQPPYVRGGARDGTQGQGRPTAQSMLSSCTRSCVNSLQRLPAGSLHRTVGYAQGRWARQATSLEIVNARQDAEAQGCTGRVVPACAGGSSATEMCFIFRTRLDGASVKS